jgi:hypothetical protein
MIEKTYERTARKLLRSQPKPKPFCKLIDGRFLTGTNSLLKTPQSRKWRTFWRLKAQRVVSVQHYWTYRGALLD